MIIRRRKEEEEEEEEEEYVLLTKCEVKMPGYWPSSFFRGYGRRQNQGPYRQANIPVNLMSNLGQ